MSSSDRQPADGSTQQPRQEVVYCHECQNEWYRSEHGLTCWRCGSDFTEILEDDKSDPREDVLGHRHDHDHDHDDVEEELDADAPDFLMRMMGGPGGGSGPQIMFRSVQTVSDGRGPPRTSTRTFTTGGAGGSAPHTAGEGTHGRPGDANAGEIYDMLSSILSNIVGSGTLGARNSQQQPQQQQQPGSAGMDSHEQQGQPRSAPEPRVFGMSGSIGGSIGGSGGGQRSFFYGFGNPRTAGTPTFSTSSGGGQPGSDNERGGINAGGLPSPPPLDFAQFLTHIFGAAGAGGGPPFMFGVPHGASGDYAWSQGDMDRIISQLMEQHQGNAAPPASDDAIKNLPKVKVTDQQLADKVECVVCRDEFSKDEELVQLPCKHTYHEECAVTWLKEHDTCPVCRTPVTPEEDREAQRQRHNEQRQQQFQEDASFLFPNFMRRGGSGGGSGGQGAGPSN